MNRPKHGRPQPATKLTEEMPENSVEENGWMVLAHPLFLDQISILSDAVERERTAGDKGPNTKLLAHLLDLAFVTIPSNPANEAFRQGHTLGTHRKHWFRGKTGNGRYRLFFRFDSRTRVIILAWVNDSETLRTRGKSTDAYTVFGDMLNSGNPPDSWDDLVRASSMAQPKAALRKMRQAK